MALKNHPVQGMEGQEGAKGGFDKHISQAGFSELRAMHRKAGLDAVQSLAFISAGNGGHVNALQKHGISPAARYAAIQNGEADGIIVYCADARNLKLDSEEDPRIFLHIRVAGNLIPDGGPSLEEIALALSKVKPKGIVAVMGHCLCGAMKEYLKWLAAGRPDTGSPELNTLLSDLSGDSPEQNSLFQIDRASKLLNTGNRKLVALVYDWNGEGVRILSENPSPEAELLRDRLNAVHAAEMEDSELKEGLANQTPHAIVVGAEDLPYSIPTIVHAKQNEVFCTTGSEFGLDSRDAASILYAVEHLGIRHIPFIATGSEEQLKGMFDKWEADIRAMTVKDKPLISQMLDSGELRISRLSYDLQNGRLNELA